MRLLVLLLALAQAIAALDFSFDAYRNQVWFHGQVNGRGPVWLLFDSAAGASSLNREITERFGLAGRQFAAATAGGAGPATLRVPVLRGITFSYRGLELAPPQVMSIPFDAVSELFGRSIDGIIGKELLLRYVVELDSSARKMALHEPASFDYRGQGHVLPIRLVEGPIVEAAIRVPGGRRLPCRLLVDTAASHSLTFTSPFCQRHGLVDAVRSLSERLTPSVGGG